MATYTQIQAQIQKLQKEAEAVRKRELAETIANIKRAIAAFGLTAADLGLARPRNAGARKTSRKSKLDKRSVVAPKYRNAATGDTWTGRGKQPKWLAAALKSGKKLEHFKI
jgi:DNA-binding protein H-NS